jgi:hypothetical protein
MRLCEVEMLSSDWFVRGSVVLGPPDLKSSSPPRFFSLTLSLLYTFSSYPSKIILKPLQTHHCFRISSLDNSQEFDESQ